jgi:hypothetical protein
MPESLGHGKVQCADVPARSIPARSPSRAHRGWRGNHPLPAAFQRHRPETKPFHSQRLRGAKHCDDPGRFGDGGSRGNDLGASGTSATWLLAVASTSLVVVLLVVLVGVNIHGPTAILVFVIIAAVVGVGLLLITKFGRW